MAGTGRQGRRTERRRGRPQRWRWWRTSARERATRRCCVERLRASARRSGASTSTRSTRRSARARDRVVVAGGDGSIAPVAAARGRGRDPARRGARRAPPTTSRAGSGCPTDITRRAGSRCTAPRLRSLELGWMNDERPFVNVASAGLPAPAAEPRELLEGPARPARVRGGSRERRPDREAAHLPRGVRRARAARRRGLAGDGRRVRRLRRRRHDRGGRPGRRRARGDCDRGRAAAGPRRGRLPAPERQADRPPARSTPLRARRGPGPRRHAVQRRRRDRDGGRSPLQGGRGRSASSSADDCRGFHAG